MTEEVVERTYGGEIVTLPGGARVGILPAHHHDHPDGGHGA